MQHLEQLATPEDLSGAWCNDSEATSAIMEAVSLATPVLEKFFIRTVNAGQSERISPSLRERCQTFIREEGDHTRVHRRFNQTLQGHLGSLPPGLSALDAVLDAIHRRFSLPKRLMLAAALEHYTAVLSKAYLAQEHELGFSSPFARELFAQHAREEIAHRSVVFDLWLTFGISGRFMRALTVLAILLGGLGYLSVAVPWILRRKTGSLAATFAALARYAMRNRNGHSPAALILELFSFARGDYHPDHLVDERTALHV